MNGSAIRSAVTVSLVPEAAGGPFVFWHDLSAAVSEAVRLGFDGIEIFPPSSDILSVSDLQKVLSSSGLALAAMGTGAGWVKHKLHLTHADGNIRDKAKQFIKSIIDVAGPCGAPAIIGSMQGRFGEGVDKPTAMAWLAEAVTELGAHAKQYGVPLIYEPLNRYETNLVNSVAQGAEFLAGLGNVNVKLLADLFHMNIEETDIAASLRQHVAHVGHVHFVDSNRRAAGMGHLDLPRIATALSSAGYTGFASAEVLPLPDSLSAAKQTMDTFRRLFR